MAKEYIEREAALDSLCTACKVVPIEEKELCPYRFAGCQEYANILTLHAADVVEVVRCRECKHRTEDDFCTGRGWPDQLVADNGFCDKGKRKDGGKDE